MHSRTRLLEKLSTAQAWLERTVKLYHLVRVDAPLPFEFGEWIESVREEKAVYLMRLKGYGEENETVDHCIVIDGGGDRIVDSSIKRKLVLTTDSLSSFASGLVTVEEIRRMVKLKKRSARERRRSKRWKWMRKQELERKKEDADMDAARRLKRRRKVTSESDSD